MQKLQSNCSMPVKRTSSLHYSVAFMPCAMERPALDKKWPVGVFSSSTGPLPVWKLFFFRPCRWCEAQLSRWFRPRRLVDGFLALGCHGVWVPEAVLKENHCWMIVQHGTPPHGVRKCLQVLKSGALVTFFYSVKYRFSLKNWTLNFSFLLFLRTLVA